MKTLAPVLALTFAACGSTPPVKQPTCDAGFCAGICCGTGTECLTDEAGAQVCAIPCKLPTDCTTDAGSCCTPVLIGGDYMGKSMCAPAPTGANSYSCTCGISSDCGSTGSMACVPLLGASSGVITGPYVCKLNDSEKNDGCGDPPACLASPQYCATDGQGNEFCSVQCSTDSDCGNPGVACCDTTCHDKQSCCGLCPP